MSNPPCRSSWIVLFAWLMAAGDVLAADARGPEQVEVFASGKEGYHTYRIPAIVVTNQGTLLAFCEGRKTGRADHGDLDLVLRRSTDGGRTWQAMQLVHEEGGNAKITIGNPCPVVDRSTGTVWLPFCRNNDRVLITHSRDDGKTWADPADITSHVKKPAWGWYATGPGHGIQLTDGRLLVPCDCRLKETSADRRAWKKIGYSHVFFSDDHGKSWQLGETTSQGMNECEAVELADGSLLLSMRHYRGPKQRAFARSNDRGRTWSEPELHPQVHCPTCQASLQRFSLPTENGKDRILYSGPGGPGRTHMTVRLTYDEGKSWPVARVIHPGPAAYSDLVVLKDGTIGCLYERGEKHPYEGIVFARFTLGWLTDGQDQTNRPSRP